MCFASPRALRPAEVTVARLETQRQQKIGKPHFQMRNKNETPIPAAV